MLEVWTQQTTYLFYLVSHRKLCDLVLYSRSKKMQDTTCCMLCLKMTIAMPKASKYHCAKTTTNFRFGQTLVYANILSSLWWNVRWVVMVCFCFERRDSKEIFGTSPSTKFKISTCRPLVRASNLAFSASVMARNGMYTHVSTGKDATYLVVFYLHYKNKCAEGFSEPPF